MLLECLLDREQDVLRFLSDLRLPPTSNQAERDIRPAKSQQKIPPGAENRRERPTVCVSDRGMGHDVGIRQDGVVPESRRPVVGMDALAVWCRRWLGAPPAAQLFEAGYLSAVRGLRLADGREVVLKVRPGEPRLTGCVAVHRALWTAGFPCPEPLVDLQPLDGYAATAEALVPAAGEPPLDSELAVLSAAALACLVELAPGPGSVPGLAPAPSWTGWDHAGSGLWPAPEDRDVDLNAYPEPRWLARVAAAVRDYLRGHGGDPVIGHGDWHQGNLCWYGPQLIAVHDWDSVICQPAGHRRARCRQLPRHRGPGQGGQRQGQRCLPRRLRPRPRPPLDP